MGAGADRRRLERDPRAIRAMFAGVARRYDLLNRVLSLRRDVAWRKRLVAAVASAPPGAVLDLATGTGDVALAFSGRSVIGGDFCLDMLERAATKARSLGRRIGLVGADALTLPFADGSFAAVTVAFGVRNFADLDAGIREMRRVLTTGGLLAVLEFHRPANRLVAMGSTLWNRLVVAPIGRLVSDDGAAYSYLPASVDSFADPRELARRLEAQRLEVVESRPLTGGIAVLTAARRVEAT